MSYRDGQAKGTATMSMESWSPDLEVFPHGPGHVAGAVLQGKGDDVSASQTATYHHYSVAFLTHCTHTHTQYLLGCEVWRLN